MIVFVRFLGCIVILFVLIFFVFYKMSGNFGVVVEGGIVGCLMVVFKFNY